MNRETGHLHAVSRRRVRTDPARRLTRRRLLIALAAALAGPRLARAQQPGRTYKVGWLATAALRSESYNVAFVQRLRELGFVEGGNLVIDFRQAGGRVERLPGLAAELGRENCDVFLASGTEMVLSALAKETRDTPIFAVANDYDLMASGHIVSLARPGGRITGLSQHQATLPAKRLELLKELLPRIERIAVFADGSTTGQLEVAQAGARRLGVSLHVVTFKQSPYDYEGAYAEATRARVEALLALTSAFFAPSRSTITNLALKHRLPSIFANSIWAETGGLLSYGPNFPDYYRRAADQVALILKGAKPAEMPVEQATRFELVINMKTAKALGLTIPQSVLVRADRVIE